MTDEEKGALRFALANGTRIEHPQAQIALGLDGPGLAIVLPAELANTLATLADGEPVM